MDRAFSQKIYIVRHGDIGLGPQKRYLGVTDVKLSAIGRKQAYFLMEYLRPIIFEAIYCSPLQRAWETAEIIASAQPKNPIVLPSLQEINMGEWEGRLFSEIRKEQPLEYERRGEDIVNYRPPGGESFRDCYQRVIPAFEKILQSKAKNILIVGHAGVNRIILSYALGLPIKKLFELKQSYGCLSVLVNEKSGFRLESYLENPVKISHSK